MKHMTNRMIVVDADKRIHLEYLLTVECRTLLAELKKLCEEANFSEIQRKCSWMKEQFEKLMFHGFDQHLECIEQLCKQGEKEAIQIEIKELDDFLREVEVIAL